MDATLLYYPFCADFGPLSFNCVYKFCKLLKEKLEAAEQDGTKVINPKLLIRLQSKSNFFTDPCFYNESG